MRRMERILAARGPYVLSDDRDRVDLDVVHGFLIGSYWAQGIPRDIVERSIRGSRVFGVYEGGAQVAFARVVSDEATFAYLLDVFVLSAHRGRGLARWLVQTILAQPEYERLRLVLLGTRDAHGLYAKVGF